MKLICGLGNPGSQYSLSRHNIGYLVIDSLCQKFKAVLKEGKGGFQFAETVFKHDGEEEDVVIVKPTLFMNLSGIPVLQLVEQFRPDLENLLLVLDDVNLPFGRIRLRWKGSYGGHRGLESVIYQLETDRFPRLRIGIGNSIDSEKLKEYVLEEFNEAEKDELPRIVRQASDAVLVYLSNPIEKAMSMVNTMNAL